MIYHLEDLTYTINKTTEIFKQFSDVYHKEVVLDKMSKIVKKYNIKIVF